MAFVRAAKNVGELVGGRRRAFTSPTKSMFSSAIGESESSLSLKGELTPVYIVCGMVAVAVAIGSHTAFQQLARHPTVHINKKRRETMPEVSDPDRTINSASKFIDGSFLRKLSQIQDTNPTLHDPIHPNPYTRPRTIETLKTVGVDPTRR